MIIYLKVYHNSGVTVSKLASSAVDHVFEPRSGQAKYYKIGMCCFPDKHAVIKRTNRLVESESG